MSNNKTVTIETKQLKEAFCKFEKLNKLAWNDQICELEYNNEKSNNVIIRILLDSKVIKECELSFQVKEEDINSPFSFESLFDLSMLSKAIKKLDKAEGFGFTIINFDKDMPKKQISVRCGSKRITIPGVGKSEVFGPFKIKDVTKEQAERSFDFEHFDELIKKSDHCILKKQNTRAGISALSYFCFKNDELVTVDGYRITKLKTGTDVGKEQILVYNEIRKIVDIFKNKIVNISVYKDGILIGDDNVKLYSEKSKDQYVDYEKFILDLDECDIFNIDREDLLNNCEFLEPVLKVCEGKKVRTAPVCFKGKDMIADTENGKVEIGLAIEGGQWNVKQGFNIKFLKDALKSFEKYTETINIAVKSSDNVERKLKHTSKCICSPAVLFDNDLQHIELVLPMYFEDKN